MRNGAKEVSLPFLEEVRLVGIYLLDEVLRRLFVKGLPIEEVNGVPTLHPRGAEEFSRLVLQLILVCSGSPSIVVDRHGVHEYAVHVEED